MKSFFPGLPDSCFLPQNAFFSVLSSNLCIFPILCYNEELCRILHLSS